MQIHQMSVTYLPEQDRILMRINTTEGEEMRLWLTRRLMVGLWPLLTKLLTEHLLKLEAAGASLRAPTRNSRRCWPTSARKSSCSTPTSTRPTRRASRSLPLGEEPLLVTDVDATPLANGPLRLNFNERPPDGDAKPRSFQMEMEPKLMQGLMHLLDQALPQSQWREPFVPAAARGDRRPDDGDAATGRAT